MTTPEAHISDSVRALSLFENYQPQFERLMDLLDINVKVDDIEAMVRVTQPWVQGDHSRPVNKIKPNNQLGQQLNQVFDDLGLLGQHDLPVGAYDETLVPGAIHRGNRHRLQFLKRIVETEVIIPGHIRLLGGERTPYLEVETEDIERSKAQIKEQTPNDPWWKLIESGQTAIVWETDLIRLEGLAQLNLQPITPDQPTGSNPERPHTRSFLWGDREVLLMHTPKVHRPHGEPRHTTEACLKDWLSTTGPEEGSKVAMLAACPHIERMGMTARRILRSEGRSDITLEVGGPAAQASVNHNHCLGEIGRSLYEVELALSA